MLRFASETAGGTSPLQLYISTSLAESGVELNLSLSKITL